MLERHGLLRHGRIVRAQAIFLFEGQPSAESGLEVAELGVEEAVLRVGSFVNCSKY